MTLSCIVFVMTTSADGKYYEFDLASLAAGQPDRLRVEEFAESWAANQDTADEVIDRMDGSIWDDGLPLDIPGDMLSPVYKRLKRIVSQTLREARA